jgi:hypothetical protein
MSDYRFLALCRQSWRPDVGPDTHHSHLPTWVECFRNCHNLSGERFLPGRAFTLVRIGFSPHDKTLFESAGRRLYDLLEAIQRHERPAARAAVFFLAFAFFLSQLCVNVRYFVPFSKLYTEGSTHVDRRMWCCWWDGSRSFSTQVS